MIEPNQDPLAAELDLRDAHPEAAAEAAWHHAEQHHAEQHHASPNAESASLLVDYMRAIAAELRAQRHRERR